MGSNRIVWRLQNRTFTSYMATAPRLVQFTTEGLLMTAERTLTDRLLDDADEGFIDPFDLFEEWFAQAKASEPNDPHAMAVATVDGDGLPDVRMVLLNAHDRRGFAFFTNFDSAKGRELLAHPKAAFVMHWKSLRRQIRVRGPVEIVDASEADDYFHSRARGSQIASSASEQSRPLRSRRELMERVETLTARLEGAEVPRPAHWSGFRIVPHQMEFWKDGEFRLHDRFLFTQDAIGEWRRQRLNP
ncbi:pyridoxine/pyridoxamine 5'-phosphate oxidase [Youhaiella tibetensis]|nr:pyridoxine/pyridoxamine 5'-phosphate oxidase [Youhaiella tibetensis]